MVPVLVPAGASFRGVLNYVLDQKKEPELIGGSLVGESARELAAEFSDSRNRNSSVTKPVAHMILTVHPDEEVTPEAWGLITSRFVEGMGYKDTEWVAVRHRDRDHDHVHIVASRVDFNGARVNDSFDRPRAHKIAREISRDFGLRVQRERGDDDRKDLNRGELGRWERTQEIPPRLLLQDLLDVAAGETQTIGDFVETARALGVEVRPNIASTGHVSGISYGLDDMAFAGSHLGRACTWQGLQSRKGLSYEPERDLAVLQATPELVRPAEALPISTMATDEGEARLAVRAAVLESAAKTDTLPAFMEHLATQGVSVQPNIASTGHITGLSFHSGSHQWKASDLGRTLSWGNLQNQHGIVYEPSRHQELVRRLVTENTPQVGRSSGDLERKDPAIAAEISRSNGVELSGYELRQLFADASSIQTLLRVAANTAEIEALGMKDFKRIEALRTGLKGHERLVHERDNHFANAYRSVEAAYGPSSVPGVLDRLSSAIDSGGAREALRQLDRPEELGELAYRRTVLGRRDESGARVHLAQARTSLQAALPLERSILAIGSQAVGHETAVSRLAAAQLHKRLTLSRLERAGRSAVTHLTRSSLIYVLPPQARAPYMLAAAAKEAIQKEAVKPLAKQALFAALPAPLRNVAIAGQAKPAAGAVYLLTSALPLPAQAVVRTILAAGRELSR